MNSQTAPRQHTLARPTQSGPIVFDNHHETYTGTDHRARRWRITPSMTGWQLMFHDPGDTRLTYAGTHPTLRDAQLEAAR